MCVSRTCAEDMLTTPVIAAIILVSLSGLQIYYSPPIPYETEKLQLWTAAASIRAIDSDL